MNATRAIRSATKRLSAANADAGVSSSGGGNSRRCLPFYYTVQDFGD
ncbi:MAG: hypothetical protein ACLUI3_07845 [Christensenellales bacterium]